MTKSSEILSFLHEEHEDLLDQLVDLEHASEEGLRDSYPRFLQKLRRYALTEFRVCYAHLRRHPEAVRYVREASLVLHRIMHLAERLGELAPSDARWASHFDELKGGLREHVEDEEDVTFKKLRKLCHDAERREMAQEANADTAA